MNGSRMTSVHLFSFIFIPNIVLIPILNPLSFIKMYISIIVAVAKNMAIGNENRLLYWLPNDLKRFKSLTTGHTIIMGRKTFDSLPKGALPNRRNVVLSRTVSEFPGAEVFTDLHSALDSCTDNEAVYIIGGESIYRQAMPLAHRLCITEIDAIPDQADAFFPAIDNTEWKEVFRESHDIDEKHLQAYSFVDYIRVDAIK